MALAADSVVPPAPGIVQALPYTTDGSNREEDRTRLAERLAGLALYSARFRQTIYGARGELLEASEGYVRLRRPDFKWVVEDPFPQIIVTDGDRLKLYDPDLEQLTIRPLDEALKDTPVSLLTRDDVVIGPDFDVFRITDDNGESYLVSPRAPDSLYRRIELHFHSAGKKSTFFGLDILDHLGQRTEIRFEPESVTGSIPDAEFELEISPDTDVIGG